MLIVRIQTRLHTFLEKMRAVIIDHIMKDRASRDNTDDFKHPGQWPRSMSF